MEEASREPCVVEAVSNNSKQPFAILRKQDCDENGPASLPPKRKYMFRLLFVLDVRNVRVCQIAIVNMQVTRSSHLKRVGNVTLGLLTRGYACAKLVLIQTQSARRDFRLARPSSSLPSIRH